MALRILYIEGYQNNMIGSKHNRNVDNVFIHDHLIVTPGKMVRIWDFC